MRLNTDTPPDPNAPPEFTVIGNAETMNDLHNALQGKPEVDFVIRTAPADRETEQFHWYEREVAGLPDPEKYAAS
jgi:hypothetical protein